MGTKPHRAEPAALPCCFRDAVRGTFTVLLEAHDAAAELGWDRLRSSVSVRELWLHGATVNQLRWLLDGGHIQLVADHGGPVGPESVAAEGHLLGPCRVILTGQGAALARAHLRGASSIVGARPVPQWDAARRTLWLGASVVKQFRVPAVNQEIVLQVFEEEGWPHTIDDPIPVGRASEGKARLHDTIRRLNDRQRVRRLRFAGNGRGDGVSWEVIETS